MNINEDEYNTDFSPGADISENNWKTTFSFFFNNYTYNFCKGVSLFVADAHIV